MGLTDRERAILDFAASWWCEPGAKSDLIKARLGLSSARYYQLLNRIIDRPEAYEHDPLAVLRLRRSRDRRQTRSGVAAGVPRRR